MDQFSNTLTMKYQRKYLMASKHQKSRILDQLEELTGLHRKSLIRKLKKRKNSRNMGKRSGSKLKYSDDCIRILEQVWIAGDYSCAELLQPAVSDIVDTLVKRRHLCSFDDRDILLVKKIPLGTLKQKLKLIKKPPSAFDSKYNTRSKSQLKKKVPICKDMNKSKIPGYLELDFVDHCTSNQAKGFVRSMCCTDIFSGWISRYSVRGKARKAVVKAFNYVIQENIPFTIHKLHTDNEANLLKSLMLQQASNKDLKISRSRSYRKEDNGHVEQKNGDKIRRLLGYKRYDTKQEELLIREIYKVDDLLQNHFVPTRQLLKKEYNEFGKLLRRIYDTAATPYQRLLKSEVLTKQQKMTMTNIHEKLDPIELRTKRTNLIYELRQLR